MECEDYKQTLLSIASIIHGMEIDETDPEFKQLVEDVWGEEDAIGVSEQALDALVRRLRDRLASIDPGHAYVVTVRGHGLRLDNPEI